MTEEWRSVAGFEGRYEVSNFGRVKSLKRMRNGKHGAPTPIPERNNKRPHDHKPTRTHAVIRVDDSGNETRFESIVSAARAMGDERKRASIGACCRGKRPTAYGYKWRYV